MAALCEHYSMRPRDVWELTVEELDALVDRMNNTRKQQAQAQEEAYG